MSTPTVGEVLTHTGLGAGYQWRYLNTTNSEYIIELWYSTTGATQTDQYIKFDPSTGTWSDVGSGWPKYFTASNTFATTTSVSGYPASIFVWHSNGSLMSTITAPNWATASSQPVTHSAGSSSSSTQKKVFCNFW